MMAMVGSGTGARSFSTVTLVPDNESDSSSSILEKPCTAKPAAGTVSNGSDAQYWPPSAALKRIRLSHFAISGGLHMMLQTGGCRVA